MARTLDPVSHAVRRDAFLDAAQRMIQSKGYEAMSLQDVLDDLDVSKGAFYHYFGSKETLLAGVIDRMVEVATTNMAPVANDPELTALEKLTRMFLGLAQWKGEQPDLMIELVQIWLSDGNAIVRDQLRLGVQAKLTPLLATIVRQGKDEGVFTVTSPEHTAGLIVGLLLGTNETASRLFVARKAGQITFDDVERTLAAHAEAFERILGLPPGSWPTLDAKTMHFWFG